MIIAIVVAFGLFFLGLPLLGLLGPGVYVYVQTLRAGQDPAFGVFMGLVVSGFGWWLMSLGDSSANAFAALIGVPLVVGRMLTYGARKAGRL